MREREVTTALYDGLREIAGVEVYAPAEEAARAGIISFNAGDLTSSEAADYLDREGIAVRGGLHCAPRRAPLPRHAGARRGARQRRARDDIRGRGGASQGGQKDAAGNLSAKRRVPPVSGEGRALFYFWAKRSQTSLYACGVADVDALALEEVYAHFLALVEPFGEVAGGVGRVALLKVGVDEGHGLALVEVEGVYADVRGGCCGFSTSAVTRAFSSSVATAKRFKSSTQPRCWPSSVSRPWALKSSTMSLSGKVKKLSEAATSRSSSTERWSSTKRMSPTAPRRFSLESVPSSSTSSARRGWRAAASCAQARTDRRSGCW